MAKVAKKICQTSIEKAYLEFDCKYLSWCLPLSKLWHPAPPNTCSRSPRGNLWHPAVRTEVRTPGGNCWKVIGSTNIFVHRKTTDRKKEWIYSLAVKCNQNNHESWSNNWCPGLTFVWTHKRLMPAKRNVTSHISFHTWSRSHLALPNFRWKRNHTCPQDDNKDTYQASILCSLTI